MNILHLLARLRVEAQRSIDHFWLYTKGMSSVKRSMLTKNLFLGGQYTVRSIGALKKLGITAIVNMRIRESITADALREFNVLHLPTPDLHAPSIAQLEEGAKFIEQEIKNGGSVYIHCHWGEGRGPSMAIAYLIYTGMTYKDAFAFVKKVRTFIRPTQEQIERLQEFEQFISQKNHLLGAI